ncbi:MAG: IPT/TIG domain-containing protein [Bacteroidota bacterium]
MPGPQLVAGYLENVSSSWQTVTLPFDYAEMVVVATVAYTEDDAPAVTRIRNAAGNSFEVRVQNPSGAQLEDYAVHYMVVEAGVYTAAEDGVQMEAGQFTSDITAHAASWLATPVGYAQPYNSPVVLGQVMSYNDERWSVFFSQGLVISSPPTAASLAMGKHVGEDPEVVRNAESIGYIVFETGIGQTNGYNLQAFLGADLTQGMEDNPPYNYPHNMEDEGFVLLSQAAMDGFNGSWSVLWADDWFDDDDVQLVVDEDQVGDEERRHSTEQVGVVILNPVVQTPEILSFSPEIGPVGGSVTILGNYFTGAQQVYFNGLPASFEVEDDQTIKATVPEGATSGEISVLTPGGFGRSAKAFEVLKVPQIFSFSPGEGPRGTSVEITGQNFVNILDVSFGGWSSKEVEIVSESQIVATVPQNSNTGRIRVRNAAGMATTPEVFRVIASAAVDEIIPSRAEAAAVIRIAGTGFLEVEAIEFAGGVGAVFDIVTDQEMRVTVPPNTTSGPVKVFFTDGTILQGPVDFTLTFAEPLQGLNLCRMTAAQVTQSSVGSPFANAGKACDGNTDGTLENASFTDTQIEQEAWWEADLGAVYNISEIAVWNRSDCCTEDLSNFFIFISDVPFASTSLSETLNAQDVASQLISSVDLFESIDLSTTGRYVRIQKIGAGMLVLAEVEIISGTGNVITSTEDPGVATSGIQLKQAYPSPFTTRATIPYAIAETQHVSLQLFDALGREVRVLQDGVLSPGSYTATVEAEDLPNGMYFYRMVAGQDVRTQALVLAR